jgi:hypothetical protein
MAKEKLKGAPHTGAPMPKARPRRQEEMPEAPRGGHRAPTRGGARKDSAKMRKSRLRGEPPVD